MLPIIQSLWIGESLSKIEQLAIRSFLGNGHEFHLYTYDKVAKVPDGTVIKDANEIIPEGEIYLSHGSYAHFADWFRWKLIESNENIWVDMDLVCIRPFDFEDEILFGKEESGKPSIGVLKFPNKHPLPAYMVDRCENPNKIRDEDIFKHKVKKFIRKYILGDNKTKIKWGEAGGPMGFHAGLEKFEIFHLAKPFPVFYPVHYKNWDTLFDNTFASDIMQFNCTYAVHLWNEFLRQDGIDKNADFHPDSLVEQLIRKYR